MTERRRHRTDEYDESLQPASPTDEADTTLLPEDLASAAPDSPTGVEDYGVTVAEEMRGEPLGDRLRREVPDTSPSHRPVDPDRVAARPMTGRLAAEGGPHIAEGDVVDLSAEEAAMHVVPGPRGRRKSHAVATRVELLEAQVTVLLTMARIHNEALQTLAEAFAALPAEEPGDAAARITKAARDAHHLLLALRGVPE